jgi:cytochrome P450
VKEIATGILAAIAAAEAEDGLPRHDAARFVMELLVAGNITTTHHLSNSMLLLARDPALADRLRREPAEIPRFVEESLRLEAPIQGFYRLAMADTEIGGVRVPEGSRVLVLYASANRDPKAWPDVDEVVLDRTNAAGHLAFGRGVHACLGAALARAEGRIAVERLLRRIDRFELIHDPDEIEYLPSAVNHGPARLPLRLTWATN